jgi:hypothetical protein
MAKRKEKERDADYDSWSDNQWTNGSKDIKSFRKKVITHFNKDTREKSIHESSTAGFKLSMDLVDMKWDDIPYKERMELQVYFNYDEHFYNNIVDLGLLNKNHKN